MMFLAASYIRTGISGESTDRQRSIIRTFASQNEIYIADDLWFIDDGVSGLTPFLMRPAGRHILETLGARFFPFVVVSAIDHVFRNAWDAISTAKRLNAKGVCIASAIPHQSDGLLTWHYQKVIDAYIAERNAECEERARKMIDG